VATLGTATTPSHLQKLLRQTDEVVFCFDGDAAGRRAAWRALEGSLTQLRDGKQIKFLLLPEADDPDSYVRREGKAAFERLLIDTAVPLSTFALKELTARADMGSAEGRARFVQEAKPLVKQISAPILGLMIRKRVAELGGISQTELEERLEWRPAGPSVEARQRAPQRTPDAYARLLERILAEPKLIAQLWPLTLPSPAVQSGEASALFDLIDESRALEAELTVAGAIELLRIRGHGVTVQRLMPVVHELQRFSAEELLDEVRGSVRTLLREAEEARRVQLMDGVSSPAELSDEARTLLARAPATSGTIKSH
jgi:DNA primase